MSMLRTARRAAKYVGHQLEAAYTQFADPKVLEYQRDEEVRDAARRAAGRARTSAADRAALRVRRENVAARVERMRANAQRAAREAEQAAAAGDPHADELLSAAGVLSGHVKVIEAELAALDASDTTPADDRDGPGRPEDSAAVRAAQDVLDGHDAAARLAEIRARLDARNSPPDNNT